MQLVLPKGKVRATFPVVFSIPVTGHSYRSKIEKEWKLL